jgi:hypothetical protein
MVIVVNERVADCLDRADYSSVVAKVCHLVGIDDGLRFGSGTNRWTDSGCFAMKI